MAVQSIHQYESSNFSVGCYLLHLRRKQQMFSLFHCGYLLLYSPVCVPRRYHLEHHVLPSHVSHVPSLPRAVLLVRTGRLANDITYAQCGTKYCTRILFPVILSKFIA